MRRKNSFKKGAASFYVVAFSTLILVIIAASFAAIIISEIARTSNDDLAQSAYDSALAGVEDAKLAFYSYQKCLAQEGVVKATDLIDDGVLTCSEIIYIIEDLNDDCDMVAKILNRDIVEVDEDGDLGVFISESNAENAKNNMLQAYTCVKISNPVDYRSTISGTNPTKLVPIKLEEGRRASEIESVRVSWSLSNPDKSITNYANFTNGKVIFPNNKVSNPPMIAVSMVQTASTFSFDSFNMTVGDTTNRGTLYLVPTNEKTYAGLRNRSNKSLSEQNYIGAYDSALGYNYIDKNGFLKSNDKSKENLPYLVYCNEPGDGLAFECSVNIDLPKPVNSVNGERNDETFLFEVSLPYGNSAVDFSLAFCDSNGQLCVSGGEATSGDEPSDSHVVSLSGVQVAIDSTGRANDLFRRVETRLEGSDTAFPYPLHAIQLLGSEDGSLLKKNIETTCEWDFPKRDDICEL